MSLKSRIQDLILSVLNQQSEIKDTSVLQLDSQPINQLEILGVLNALSSREVPRVDQVVAYDTIVTEKWVLTEEGKSIAETGSHEARVYNAVPPEGISISELNVLAIHQKLVGASAKFGQGAAFKAKWIAKTSEGNLIKNVESIVDQAQLDLRIIEKTGTHSDAQLLKTLKKRQLIATHKDTCYSVKKGTQFTLDIKKQQTDVTAEMLAR